MAGQGGAAVSALSPSGLPAPGQGPCAECGHYPLIHGRNRCHYVDEATAARPYPPNCDCSGYVKREVAIGPLRSPVSVVDQWRPYEPCKGEG